MRNTNDQKQTQTVIFTPKKVGVLTLEIKPVTKALRNQWRNTHSLNCVILKHQQSFDFHTFSLPQACAAHNTTWLELQKSSKLQFGQGALANVTANLVCTDWPVESRRAVAGHSALCEQLNTLAMGSVCLAVTSHCARDLNAFERRAS